MDPIICQNDAGIVLHKIREYLASGKIVQDIYILEQNDDQIVFLLGDEKKIEKKEAQIWWSGYSEGMKAVLS